MKLRQMDIFGYEKAAARPKAKKSAGALVRKGRRRRRHEVKKAPMLVDAYQPIAGTHFKTSPPSNSLPCRQAGLPQGGGRKLETLSLGERKVSSPHIHTVTEITDNIRDLLERKYTDVWVTGEVTDFRNQSGRRHYYFSLKDERSKLKAVIFGAAERALNFELADGMELICHGKINVYAPQGSYQIVVDFCEPKGIGALQLAFEQLKKKLAAEGLFEPSRKRPIPYLPQCIGVVTSESGAAIRDIIQILKRRQPSVNILLHPVRVQGEGAAVEIAEAIRTMNGLSGIDVLIVGRGGGSMEDLWEFNEEVVARAIAASKLPVISAVGHEIDFTIADFVADVRAATPSAAAELAVPVRTEVLSDIGERRRRLTLLFRRRLDKSRHEFAVMAGRLPDLRRRLPDLALRVDSLAERLAFSERVVLGRDRQRLEKLSSNLRHLSPHNILAKGYAVVEAPDGRVVKSVRGLNVGDDLGLRFSEGRARARVTKLD